jgi:hypothetical protein
MVSKLEVDTIAHSGGTTGMTIDSTGRILTPARPAFRARLTTGSGGGSNGTLVFNTEDFDIGGNYNTSNGRFTAPVAGVYWICFSALSAGDSSGSSLSATNAIWIHLHKNGTEIPGTVGHAYIASGNHQESIHSPNVLSLSASDYITVVVGSEYVYTDATARWDPVFQGYLLG